MTNRPRRLPTVEDLERALANAERIEAGIAQRAAEHGGRYLVSLRKARKRCAELQFMIEQRQQEPEG